jgi:putative flippase GtrA
MTAMPTQGRVRLPAPFAKLVRFALVGATNGIIYAAATALYIEILGVNSTLASGMGYFTVLPFAFVAQREFTFAGRGRVGLELIRFVATHLASLGVSVLAMFTAVDYLGLHYIVGIAAAIGLVPLVTFFVMDRWVFRNQGPSPAEDELQ